jgi:hypothetical protein
MRGSAMLATEIEVPGLKIRAFLALGEAITANHLSEALSATSKQALLPRLMLLPISSYGGTKGNKALRLLNSCLDGSKGDLFQSKVSAKMAT